MVLSILSVVSVGIAESSIDTLSRLVAASTKVIALEVTRPSRAAA